jgi:hypothetical protein
MQSWQIGIPLSFPVYTIADGAPLNLLLLREFDQGFSDDLRAHLTGVISRITRKLVVSSTFSYEFIY